MRASTNPDRRLGEQKCDRRLLQMVPANLDARGKTRVKPWRIVKTFHGKGIIEVEATANEEIRVNDVLTLIGITGVIQDAIECGAATVSLHKAAGNQEIALVSVVLSSYKFCLAAAGDHNVAEFVATLERLQSYNCRYKTEDGSVGSNKYIYEYCHDVESKQISVLMKKNHVDYFAAHGWVLDVNDIRARVKKSGEQALVLYLSQQPGGRFHIDTLSGRINIKCAEKKERRRKMREIISGLKTAGYIKSYAIDGDYVTINRSADGNE